MSEQQGVMAVIIFLVGILCGVILTLITNKIRSGSASPTKIKREMEDYQDKVEAHFDQTSEKFKQMANQYQDLYKHLSVGATTLCRPENIAPGLVADKDPLSTNLAIDKKTSADPVMKSGATKETTVKQQQKTDSKIKAEQAKTKQDASKQTTKGEASKQETKGEASKQETKVEAKTTKSVQNKAADAAKKA